MLLAVSTIKSEALKRFFYVYNLVYSSIDAFFVRNVLQYDYAGQNVSFVGSNACAYSGVLAEVAKKYDITIQKILPSSVPGLVKYHATNPQK